MVDSKGTLEHQPTLQERTKIQRARQNHEHRKDLEMIKFDGCMQLDVAERMQLEEMLNKLNKFAGSGSIKNIEILENYQGRKLTVLRVTKGESKHILNVTGNSLPAILKELMRFLAEGDMPTGYMGKED